MGHNSDENAVRRAACERGEHCRDHSDGKCCGCETQFEIVVQWTENGDGTADVSRDGGKTWKREPFPIALHNGEQLHNNGMVMR